MMTSLRAGLGCIFAVAFFTAQPSAANAQAPAILSPDLAQLRSASALPAPLLQPMPLAPGACGVNLDGSSREPNLLGLALSGNPWQEGLQRSAGDDVVRLLDGAYAPTDVEFSLPTRGPAVIIGRTFFHGLPQGVNNPPVAADSLQGWNWHQTAWPEVVAAGDRVFLVYGGDRYASFLRYGGSTSGTFRGVNGAAGAIVHTAAADGQPDLWTYFDAAGNRADFLGTSAFHNSASLAGRLWRIVDGADRALFVGHASNAATACTDGFDDSGRVLRMTDGAGRTFAFSYGAARLSEVVVWASDGTTRLATISYSYYAANQPGGLDGDLKFAHVEIAASPALNRYRYYRYWTQNHSATVPGYPHQPRMVVGEEGCRRFHVGPGSSASSLEAGLETATDAALLPFASLVLEYDASGRVSKTIRPGEANHAPDIEESYTYTTNPNFSTIPGGYVQAWKSSTTVKRSSTAWTTCFFDEAGQSLGVLVSDNEPTSSGSFRRWMTDVHRDAAGCVDRIATPASMPASALAPADPTDAGLVMNITRVASGPMTGFAKAVCVRSGEDTSGATTLSYLSTSAYLGEDSNSAPVSITRGGYAIVRPLIASVRRFDGKASDPTTTSNAPLTQLDYIADTDSLRVRQVTVHLPAVSGAHNGDAQSTWTRASYFTRDGLVQFTRTPVGASSNRIDYVEYDDITGRPSRSVTDASTSTDCGNATIPAGFASDSGGDLLRRDRGYAYDAWGRLFRSRGPDGHVQQISYSALSDGRPVALQFPRVNLDGAENDPLGSRDLVSWYAPAQCSVLTLDGLPSASLLLAPQRQNDWFNLTLNFTSTANPASLVSPTATAGSDPLRVLASVATASGFVRGEFRGFNYTNNGRSLLTIDRYTDLGSESLAWDATQLDYDALGRLYQTMTPAGTMNRVAYDDATGRVIGASRGTTPGSFVDTVRYVYGDETAGDHAGNGLLKSEQRYNTRPGSGGTYGTNAIEQTDYFYDFRGRVIGVNGPAAPHSLFDYDNQSRLTSAALLSEWNGGLVTGSWNSGELGYAPDASTLSSRRALARWSYDELGRVYQEQRANIDQFTGAVVSQSVDAPWQTRSTVYTASGATASVVGGCVGCGGGSITVTKIATNRANEPILIAVCASNGAPSGYDDAISATAAADYHLHDTYFIRNPKTGDIDAVLEAQRGPQPGDSCVTPGGGPIVPGVPGGTGPDGNFTLNPAWPLDANLQLHMIWRDDLGRPRIDADWGYRVGTPNPPFPLLYSSVLAANASDIPASTNGTSLYSNAAFPTRLSTTFYNELGYVENTSSPGGEGRFHLYDDAGRENGSGPSWSPFTQGAGIPGFPAPTPPLTGYNACDPHIGPSLDPPPADSHKTFDKDRLLCSSTAGTLKVDGCRVYEDHLDNPTFVPSAPPYVDPSSYPTFDLHSLPKPAVPSNDIPLGMMITERDLHRPTDQYQWFSRDVQDRPTHIVVPGELHKVIEYDPYGRPRERYVYPWAQEQQDKARRIADAFDGLGRLAQRDDSLIGDSAPLSRRRFHYDAFGNPLADFQELFPESGGFTPILGMALKQEFRSRDLIGSPGSFLGGSNLRTPTRIELPGGMVLQPWYGTCSQPADPNAFLSSTGMIGPGGSLDLDAALARPSRVDMWTNAPPAPIVPFENPASPFNPSSIVPSGPGLNPTLPPPLTPPAMKDGYHGIAFPSWFEQPAPWGTGVFQQPTDVCSCTSPFGLPTDYSPPRNPYGEPTKDTWRMCAGANPCDPNSYPSVRDGNGDDSDWYHTDLDRSPHGPIVGMMIKEGPRPPRTITIGTNDHHSPQDLCCGETTQSLLAADTPTTTITARAYRHEPGSQLLREESITFGRSTQRLIDYSYLIVPGRQSLEWGASPAGWGVLLEQPQADSSGAPKRVTLAFTHDTSPIRAQRLTSFTRSIEDDATATTSYTVAYDAHGNLTDDGVQWVYDYSVHADLERVFRRDPQATDHRGRLFAKFRHDAAGRMIAAVYDLNIAGVPDIHADAVFDDDTIEYYGYDDRDRLVCVWRQGPGSPRPDPVVYERIVHRTGGRGMSGEGWFLDAPIYAQIDADADGSFETEHRYLQSAVNGDILGLIPAAGRAARLDYSMFGLPRLAPAPNGFCRADVDDGSGTGSPDGGVDFDDLSSFLAAYEPGDLAADLDDGSGLGIPDDGVDANDLLYFLTAFEEGTRGGDINDLRFAWRGYRWDKHLQLYHVRHRAFDPKLMVWLQPDPLGEIDGPNPYAYVGWDPFNKIDPLGLSPRLKVDHFDGHDEHGISGRWTHFYTYDDGFFWDTDMEFIGSTFTPKDVDANNLSGWDPVYEFNIQRQADFEWGSQTMESVRVGVSKAGTILILVAGVPTGPVDALVTIALSKYGVKTIVSVGGRLARKTNTVGSSTDHRSCLTVQTVHGGKNTPP